jgi:hypothetical protein
MIKKLAVITSLLLTFFVSACTTNNINHFQLAVLDKGMVRAEVAAKLKKPVYASAVVQTDGRSITFDRYAMNNGVQTDWYFLAFEKERLIYWGYASEFRKLSDATLNKAIDEGMRATTPSR